MATITKLKVVHAICVNLIGDTSMNDPRMKAIISVREGIAESINELEFGEEPKSL